MTIVVVARYRAAEGLAELVAAALKEYTPLTRAEPGCATFVALRSRDESREFLLYEEYDDLEALDAHRASHHFSAVARDRIWPMLESRDVTLCDVLGS
jgi:quinol monooxygenase YgiN